MFITPIKSKIIITTNRKKEKGKPSKEGKLIPKLTKLLSVFTQLVKRKQENKSETILWNDMYILAVSRVVKSKLKTQS